MDWYPLPLLVKVAQRLMCHMKSSKPILIQTHKAYRTFRVAIVIALALISTPTMSHSWT